MGLIFVQWHILTENDLFSQSRDREEELALYRVATERLKG